ncbi:ABC transporter ATP-binding protein [Veronia nyctiphanis]|uniref:ABC transporter ATP-binding protein n=1 Tax=Veronia nyctiphanis TaxID=1278244 RepID=A0A4Q0YPS8_9GAMM|nr:ABC transporter ATP-binding protein [Veronia nyctiphanis]RXJ73057.1 ABC transporter ATP-binding protein [Veronia nyctiphanis]
MAPLVEVKKVSKQYGSWRKTNGEALSDVSFTLHPGQIMGLLGHNGAGKSTLIKALLGSHKADGTIKINGSDPIADRTEVMKSLSYISDVNVLPGWMKVGDLLKYVDGVHPSFNLEKARAILNSTDVTEDKKIKTLSKGMKVQVHLAIVVATDTKVLILDEPTLGLDLMYRDVFYRHLIEWFEDGQRSMIIASHEVAEIEHLLTDVLILKKGKTVYHGSMEDMSSKYFMLEASQTAGDKVAPLAPIFSRKGLGTCEWMLDAKHIDAVRELGTHKPVQLANLFLALQGEEA